MSEKIIAEIVSTMNEMMNAIEKLARRISKIEEQHDREQSARDNDR